MRWGKKNVNSDTVPAEGFSEVIGEHQPCVRAISRTEGWRYAWEITGPNINDGLGLLPRSRTNGLSSVPVSCSTIGGEQQHG